MSHLGCSQPLPQVRYFFLLPPNHCCLVSYPPPPSSHFFLLVLEKVRKKKDAAQTPRRLGAPKPKCKMAIRILCGPERARGLTGFGWKVNKEGQRLPQKPIL